VRAWDMLDGPSEVGVAVASASTDAPWLQLLEEVRSFVGHSWARAVWRVVDSVGRTAIAFIIMSLVKSAIHTAPS
jgi:hypothetical protein